MNNTDTTLSPSRTIDAWRHWFRVRHATRDRREKRPPELDGFAVTEWADTVAGVAAVTDAEDTLHPPHHPSAAG